MKKNVSILNKDKQNIYLFGYGIVGTAYGSTSGLGCLMLFDLKPNVNIKVGDEFKEKDIKKNGYKTALFFSNQKDVDDMIKRLKTIKSEMKKDSIKKGKKK